MHSECAIQTLPAPAEPPHYLQPGEWLVATAPTEVRTLLGSCISVCLWDSRRRIGGLNHYLLPQGRAQDPRPGRFGNLALPVLLDAMRRAGAERSDLIAKVFGGAAMLPNPQPRHIGAQNLEFARGWLAAAGIPVTAHDTGGARGRKLVFRTDDASAAVWEL